MFLNGLVLFNYALKTDGRKNKLLIFPPCAPMSRVKTTTDNASSLQPTSPICALNIFLLHPSSKEKKQYAILTSSYPTPASLLGAKQCGTEGSEVFSWAKPPPSPSDELTWFESMLPQELFSGPAQ